jgi:hypothetical protein
MLNSAQLSMLIDAAAQHIPYEALRRATFTVDMTESQRDGVDSVLPTKAVHQRFYGNLGRAVNRNGFRILRLNTRRSQLAVRSIGHDRRTDHNSSRLASKGKLDFTSSTRTGFSVHTTRFQSKNPLCRCDLSYISLCN